MKQKDRLRDIGKEVQAAEIAAGQAKADAEAWQRAERSRIDGEMSARIGGAGRTQSLAVAAAKSARSLRMNEIEKEHRRAQSAADSARAKSRNEADAAQQAVIDEAQARFNEASAPVEAWYTGEKERIASEAKAKVDAAAAAFEAAAKPLMAEAAALQAKAMEGPTGIHSPTNDQGPAGPGAG